MAAVAVIVVSGATERCHIVGDQSQIPVAEDLEGEGRHQAIAAANNVDQFAATLTDDGVQTEKQAEEVMAYIRQVQNG